MNQSDTNNQISGCMGCGVCENNNPEIFRLNNSGIAEVVDKDKFEQFSMDNADWGCPISAINK